LFTTYCRADSDHRFSESPAAVTIGAPGFKGDHDLGK
jgi:hypothetical protein